MLLLFERPPQVIEYNPSQCLDWLAVQTPRNKLAHSWVLQNMENWVERFLLAHNYPRVRTCEDESTVFHFFHTDCFFLGGWGVTTEHAQTPSPCLGLTVVFRHRSSFESLVVVGQSQ